MWKAAQEMVKGQKNTQNLIQVILRKNPYIIFFHRWTLQVVWQEAQCAGTSSSPASVADSHKNVFREGEAGKDYAVGILQQKY